MSTGGRYSFGDFVVVFAGVGITKGITFGRLIDGMKSGSGGGMGMSGITSASCFSSTSSETSGNGGGR